MTDAASSEVCWEGRIDPEALLAALVIVPGSYPRNRFYSLFKWPPARRARRRATILRSLIADLLGDAETIRTEASGGDTLVRYRLDELGVNRCSRLTADEIALLCRCLLHAEPTAERLELLQPVTSAACADRMSNLSDVIARLFPRA